MYALKQLEINKLMLSIVRTVLILGECESATHANVSLQADLRLPFSL